MQKEESSLIMIHLLALGLDPMVGIEELVVCKLLECWVFHLTKLEKLQELQELKLQVQTCRREMNSFRDISLCLTSCRRLYSM